MDILADLRSAAVDTELFDVVRLRVLDTLGVAAIGGKVAGVGELDAWQRADPLSSLISLCAAARAGEIDDIHIESCTTIGGVIVPVALCAGVLANASDGVVCAAIITGYETVARLGLSVRGAEQIYAGLWPTSFAATIGAAVVAAHIFGFDNEATAHAIAIAATRTNGVSWLGEDPSARWLALASAAAEGVRCASFAAAGRKGDLAAFGTLLERIGGVLDTVPLLAPLTRARAIDGVDVKPVCTARQLMASVEAARELSAVELSVTGKILVRVPAQCRAMVDRATPTLVTSCASAQFQVAAALVQPKALFCVKRDAWLHDASIRRVMGQVEVIADAALTALYPRVWGGAVEIATSTGTQEVRILEPFGCASRPIGEGEILAKLAEFGLAGNDFDSFRRVVARFGEDSDAYSSQVLVDAAFSMMKRTGPG